MSVKFAAEGVEATGAITSIGPNRIDMQCPGDISSLPSGTEVSVTVVRTIDGTDYASNAKTATVVSEV